MLGCNDFCGYYDWSFHYVRRRWGRAGIEVLWREAIGGDSQRHYSERGLKGDSPIFAETQIGTVPSEAAVQDGLRALYEVWVGTGQDEHCDWTFTLDEAKNVLRWDMRQCPSKGFLLQNDLNADEDYCNHCMGWIIPMLEGVGAELVEHEHNHCGQCWATMRMKDRPSGPLHVAGDIRNDPRWNCGYLGRWADNRPLPFQASIGPAIDPCEVLESWFSGEELTLLDDGADVTIHGTPVILSAAKDLGCGTLPDEVLRCAQDDETSQDDGTLPVRMILASDAAYNDPRRCPVEPLGVLIGCPPADLAATAARYRAARPEQRPLLMHPYLPASVPADFVSAGLLRPVPILPLLIRKGEYKHQPGGPHPTTGEFLALLAAALGKRVAAKS
jgi:hypothetical protein